MLYGELRCFSTIRDRNVGGRRENMVTCRDVLNLKMDGVELIPI
ncbi:MAG: hypothetical protein ACI39W_00840 [Brotaphodocola sp.]